MARLKITPSDYAKLETACRAVLDAHPDIKEEYSKAGFSAMRLNWDVLRASIVMPERMSGMSFTCDVLYKYLNDSHVGSALAKIMDNDGRDSKGKR